MAKFSVYIVSLYRCRNPIFKMLSNSIRETIWN